jgi:hypothetical protein
MKPRFRIGTQCPHGQIACACQCKDLDPGLFVTFVPGFFSLRCEGGHNGGDASTLSPSMLATARGGKKGKHGSAYFTDEGVEAP